MTSAYKLFVTDPFCKQSASFSNGATGIAMPVLRPDLAEKIDFVAYRAPSTGCLTDEAALEEWMTRATFIEEDLRFLLRMPYDRFWCQVVYDKSLHSCIGSFLHNAPRPFDFKFKLPSELLQKNNSLLRLFFFVCLRISTHKELSKDNQISPEAFGDILYENFIFDVPKIMDICVLFGKSNDTLVSKMVSNIFLHQEKYFDDLLEVVSTTVQVFETIYTTYGRRNNSLVSPPKRITDSKKHANKSLFDMPIEKLQDVIFYLSDITHTLRSFLEIFPQGSLTFTQHSFPHQLAVLYEVVSSQFVAVFMERSWDASEVEPSKIMKKMLCHIQINILHIFHIILSNAFLGKMVDNLSDSMSSEYVEGYITVISSVLSEKHFLADLQVLYPFDSEKEILGNIVYKLDPMRLQYIEDAISEAVKMFRRSSKQGAGILHNQDASRINGTLNQLDAEEEYDSYEELGACASKTSGIELESLIASVKDLFPHLGDGFIHLCLVEYGCDLEKVIAAIVENNLLPSLQVTDRSLPRNAGKAEETDLTKDLKPPGSVDKSLLGQRSNIFDGDEFDAFNSSIDTSRVHIGKKNKTANEEKTDMASLKVFYEKFSVDEVIANSDNECFEDEYDDTYDSIVVGTIDDDSPDELMARRPFVTPRIFEKIERRTKNYAEEESSDEDIREVGKRQNFIEDPAKLRQMREEQFASRSATRGRSRGGRQLESTQETVRDVKGGPKGRGQTAEVLRNRLWKERHKGNQVNHSRKDLADRKRRF